MADPINRLTEEYKNQDNAAAAVTEAEVAAVAPADRSSKQEENSALEIDPQLTEASTPFIGQWQTLVSTTNWGKGEIICRWRRELEDEGAALGERSDEAWAQMVGGVTSQHVGRLRRTFDRFGESYESYEGLYWSHFHAALDWQDAEMWLEGALQNKWSISQMRAKRWETLGEGTPPPAATDTDAAGEEMQALQGELAPVNPVDGESDDATSQNRFDAEAHGNDDSSDDSNHSESSYDESDNHDGEARPTEAHRSESVRPFAGLAELPEDLAEAFEQFKLAILTHKLVGWQEIGRDDVLACLDALKQLAVTESDSDSQS